MNIELKTSCISNGVTVANCITTEQLVPVVIILCAATVSVPLLLMLYWSKQEEAKNTNLKKSGRQITATFERIDTLTKRPRFYNSNWPWMFAQNRKKIA